LFLIIVELAVEIKGSLKKFVVAFRKLSGFWGCRTLAPSDDGASPVE